MEKKLMAVIATFLILFIATFIIILASVSERGASYDAMILLTEGNERFVDEDLTHPNQDEERREEIASKGQHPYATVITCSDSRVSPEIIFDAGLGDLFVIRVAGNVCDVDEVASIEYGVLHLHTPLVVVLGHTNCGAVTAVCRHDEFHGSLAELLDNIVPAYKTAKLNNPELNGVELVPATVKLNVRQAINDLLESSPEIMEKADEGDVKIVGAVYDLKSGEVEWLGSPPTKH